MWPQTASCPSQVVGHNQRWSQFDVDGGNGFERTFVFTPSFGQDALSGFAATGSGHDILQFSIADFSYLNSGMTQAQDLAAVLANATSSGANTVITDTFGEPRTLAGIKQGYSRCERGGFCLQINQIS